MKTECEREGFIVLSRLRDGINEFKDVWWRTPTDKLIASFALASTVPFGIALAQMTSPIEERLVGMPCQGQEMSWSALNQCDEDHFTKAGIGIGLGVSMVIATIGTAHVVYARPSPDR